ncbi:MAG: hypothetical protein ACK58O_13805, partial [Brevundimonas sp.]
SALGEATAVAPQEADIHGSPEDARSGLLCIEGALRQPAVASLKTVRLKSTTLWILHTQER